MILSINNFKETHEITLQGCPSFNAWWGVLDAYLNCRPEFIRRSLYASFIAPYSTIYRISTPQDGAPPNHVVRVKYFLGHGISRGWLGNDRTMISQPTVRIRNYFFLLGTHKTHVRNSLRDIVLELRQKSCVAIMPKTYSNIWNMLVVYSTI